MSSRKKTFVYGTMILTASGLINRLIGFFYKIFLSQTIGAAEIGVFQMVAPIYTLALAICVGGIATVMSRMIAAASVSSENTSPWKILLCGTTLCTVFSLVISILLHLFSETIAQYYFHDCSHSDLLRILSWSIVPSALHSCLMSYYYAKKKAVRPSISQLIEQTVRVVSSLVIYMLFRSRNQIPDASLPAISLLFGELAACQYSLLCIANETQKPSTIRKLFDNFRTNAKSIFFTALPLTGNRISIMLLHSIEAILIPRQLQLGGATSQEAFTVYGVFAGMALPMILFPNTLANAASVMLLPSIAEDQAHGNQKSIKKTIRAAITLCLITGGGAALFFFAFGRSLGILLFHNLQAGLFLQILSFISPFLYLNATLTGILHGLGKTTSSFIINSSGLIIRILFVLFAIPTLGIHGYLYGILASELLSCLMTILFLCPYYR